MIMTKYMTMDTMVSHIKKNSAEYLDGYDDWDYDVDCDYYNIINYEKK